MTDTLPTDVTFVSATPDQGACTGPVGRVLTCNLGNLAVGEFTEVRIVVKPTVAGTILNVAQVAGIEYDPKSSNNISPQTTTVERVLPEPPDGDEPTGVDLFILKFVSPDPAVVGDEIIYTIIVGNNGAFGTEATLTDTLPAGVTFLSASPSQGEACTEAVGQVTCNLGTVPPLGQGDVVIVEIIVRADQTGTLPNIAQITGSANDPNTANNVAIVASDVVSGSGDGTPNPNSDTGDSDGSNSSCSLIAGNPNGGDTAFNLGLLLLPLFIIGVRSVRRKN